MIDLTPLEVRKKKGDFKRGMRGYDTELVDDFLDLVADRLEQLVRENMAHNERLARLEQQVTDFREREKALTEALVTAQEYREESRRQATRDADLLLREAEAAAEEIRARALREREKEEEATRRVRARRAHLIQTFRAFLEREIAELAVQQEALQLQEGEEAAWGRRGEHARGSREATERTARPPAQVIFGGEEEEIPSVLDFTVREDEDADLAEQPAAGAANFSLLDGAVESPQAAGAAGPAGTADRDAADTADREAGEQAGRGLPLAVEEE